VQVSADADDGVVRFAVRDTGIGLAPEGFQRVFHDPHIDAPVQRTLRGIGLRLPLARKLARLLGG
jgi:signal transduction histidine kinase